VRDGPIISGFIFGYDAMLTKYANCFGLSGEKRTIGKFGWNSFGFRNGIFIVAVSQPNVLCNRVGLLLALRGLKTLRTPARPPVPTRRM